MAVPTKPPLKQAYGNDSWGFVLAVASITAPTLLELNASTGFNLSCSVFGDSQEGFTATTEKVTLPRLLCETTQYQVNGSTTYEMADLTISFDPQGAPASVGKKAWETMVDGIAGFLWERQGVTGTADLATGQYVNILPVTLGVKTPIKTSQGADGVFAFTQPVSVTSKPAFNVAIV